MPESPRDAPISIASRFGGDGTRPPMTAPLMRKKLIEVALPLDAINAAAAREKSIRHGHPSTLHLWWARRPLAAARAVLFAQMVDDPASRPELFATVEEQDRERERLFRLIEELVKWENTTNETVLQAARDEIRESWRRTCADNADHPRAAELFDPERLIVGRHGRQAASGCRGNMFVGRKGREVRTGAEAAPAGTARPAGAVRCRRCRNGKL